MSSKSERANDAANAAGASSPSPATAWVDIGCIAAAGSMARVIGHPLDTVKTVAIASEGSAATASPAHVARRIYAREGMRGFFRGVGIAGVGSAPGVALYITTYDRAKNELHQVTGIAATNPAVHLGAGFAAEAVSCVVWLPIDVVKERLQVQHFLLQKMERFFT